MPESTETRLRAILLGYFPMFIATLSLLTARRRHAPQGRAGGGPGRPGRNLVNGEELPPKATRELAAGDVVTVETPGGGGWGV